MENYQIPQNIRVIGLQVKTFPNGISEAFLGLMKKLPEGNSRTYYGIGECINGEIIYIAAALEKYEGEGKQYGLVTYEVEKGNYLAEEILNWRPKTNTIKDVFEEMYKDQRADSSKPSIEIYEREQKMLCLVKVDESKIAGAKKQSRVDNQQDMISR
jgi:hypothetical protein